MKLAKLLVKFKLTEEATKSIIVNGIDRGEEIEHLDEKMCNSFFQECRKPGADQKGVVVSMMSEACKIQ